jgi:hypothetical protein
MRHFPRNRVSVPHLNGAVVFVERLHHANQRVVHLKPLLGGRFLCHFCAVSYTTGQTVNINGKSRIPTITPKALGQLLQRAAA